MQDCTSLKIGDLNVTFYRTCRVPRQEGHINELPAGLGVFPTYRVADYALKVPENWKREGHFFPMYPHEAMWIGFNRPSFPIALLIGAGMINAITGTRLEPTLSNSSQNYLVVPPQPWLDGFKPTKGEQVFQFVAAELGKGETAEEQILGTSEFGGLQFGLFASKMPLISATRPHEHMLGGILNKSLSSNRSAVRTRGATTREMGLGAGGAIRQKIYPDPYLNGRNVNEVWNDKPYDKAYIYIVHSNDFRAITGQDAPRSPITYQTYQQQGLPWFGLSDGSWGDIQGGQNIDNLRPVSGNPDPVNASTEPAKNPNTQDLW